MIRLATLKDIPALLRLGKKFHESAELSNLLDYDTESVSASISNMIEGDAGAVIVSTDGSKITGMIGLISFPSYMNFSTKLAQELFWWVEPEYRKTGVGVDLIKAAETWAELMEVSHIIMMSLESSNPEQVNNLYTKLGYTKKENTFYKGIK